MCCCSGVFSFIVWGCLQYGRGLGEVLARRCWCLVCGLGDVLFEGLKAFFYEIAPESRDCVASLTLLALYPRAPVQHEGLSTCWYCSRGYGEKIGN